MEQYMIWIWLAVVAISLIYEFFSASLTSLWFAIGGLVSLILAATKSTIITQIIMFFIVSLVFLLSLRKIALNYLYKNKDSKTNMDAIIGTQHTLLKSISDDNYGLISINGVEWNCIAENPHTKISEGTNVTIIEIRGNKLIVSTKIKKEK